MLCSRVENLLSAYCDHELTGEEMLRMQQHLSRCSGCRAEHETLVRLKRMLCAAPDVEPFLPFSMEWVEARAQVPSPLRSSRLTRALERLREAGTGLRRALPAALPSFGISPRRLAVAGALVLSALAGVLVRQPQLPDAVSAHVPAAFAGDRAPAVPPPPPNPGVYAAPGLEPVYYQYYTGTQLTHTGPDDLMPWDGRVSASANLVHWQRVSNPR